MSEDDFKWSNDDSVVIRPVDAIAVYTNKDGDIVIRQQSRLGEDDTFVILPQSRVDELIVALQKESKGDVATFQREVR